MKILALDLGKSNSAVCVLDTIAMKECYTTIAATPTYFLRKPQGICTNDATVSIFTALLVAPFRSRIDTATSTSLGINNVAAPLSLYTQLSEETF
jgi:hypothetical protein